MRMQPKENTRQAGIVIFRNIKKEKRNGKLITG